MMNQPVYRCGGGHRVFEDYLPFTEWQIARNQYAAAFIPICQQRKQNLHLLSVLFDIPKVINHQHIKPRQLLEPFIKLQLLLGSQ